MINRVFSVGRKTKKKNTETVLTYKGITLSVHTKELAENNLFFTCDNTGEGDA